MFSSRKTAAPSTGYNLTKSLRFRSSASAYMNRTPATATNRKTWTWSAWVKLGAIPTDTTFFAARTASGGTYLTIGVTSSSDFRIQSNSETSYPFLKTNALFRDPSAWYHFVVAMDTTQATSTNRAKVWVNGVAQTFASYNVPAQNTDLAINSTETHLIGQQASGSYFDGYQSEVNFIDGQALTPSSFGSTNASTGVWQPAKYTGTYGTNGFYLKFTDTTSTSTLGTDYSGNSNTWTTNNFSLTAGSTYDSMTDVPTLTSATTANYCVFNPLNCNSNITLSNGNLSATSSTNGANTVIATMPIPSTGKAYWEYKITAVASSLRINLGAASTTSSITPTVNPSNIPDAFALNWATGFNVNVNGSYTYGPTGSTNLSVNDVVMIAYDATTGNLWGGLNGTWYNSGNPAAGTGSITTMTAGLNWLPYAYLNTSGGANATDVNFGQQPFAYTQPTGFNSINAYNLPTSTIVKSNTVMDATLYTGTLLSNAITNAAGFKPDLVWIKSRSAATDNKLTDSVRGATKAFISNIADGETTDTQGLTAFNSGGFTVGTDTTYNNLTATYVGWQWQAGQGSSASNTSGSITSTVSKNTTAGFSIVTYSGNSTSGATIGHGLGVTPNIIIVKRLNATLAQSPNAIVYHSSLGNTKALILDSTTSAQTATGFWNNTSPSSSVFTVGNDANTNVTSFNYVAYCWSQIAGFSSFGSYTGNGSTDGPFVYTGFRPRYWLIKCTSAGYSWEIYDTARNTYNAVNTVLLAENASSEFTGGDIDFLSNGFKLRTTRGSLNTSSLTYIYAAFAENPFKYANAR